MNGKSDVKEWSELENDFELSFEEPADEGEIEDQLSELIEQEPDSSEAEEPAEELEEPGADFAERFYELSLRKFEAETELDDAVNSLINEMEREYFFKGLKKLWGKVKKGGKWLLKKGMKLAKGLPVFQVVKGVTQLARGNLKGLLSSLAKSGLASVIPGGSILTPALKALGFGESEYPEENQEAWNNFVALSKEAFENLALNLNENADEPVEASRLATEAFQSALKTFPSPVRGGRPRKKVRTILVMPGETVILKGVKHL